MKKITTLIIIMGLVAGTSFSQTGFTTNLLFVAKLVGEQEVPPVITPAIGEASFALSADRDSLCINVTVKGLSSAITGAHIHEAPIGGTGSVVVSLTNNIIGNRISTVITSPTLDDLFIARLLNGSFYINVHTTNFPDGEIRGQIELEADIPLMATLDGAQETPAVSTTATGLAVFDLSRSMTSMRINAIFENLSGPITGIHLHSGAIGVGGPVVMDLMPGLTGNKLNIVLAPDSFITELIHGDLYINVHTGANPNGEIRGQILRQKPLSFDALLDGSQETPAVVTNATGLGLISFNATLDTIWFDYITEGLSSAPSSAHFHTAPFGTGGPVSVDLSSSLNGNQLHGMVTGAGIPAGFINDCLLGNVYINFHNTANPNGEIRGQLKRYAREGFTFSIDASQETSGSTSAAVGSGIASIDRDAEALHFRIIVVGLTDTIQSAHFHDAPAGSPGLVIYDLTPFFSHTSVDDAAFNYWKSIDGFDSSKVALFLNNSVYVNIHTSNFTDGEVRGQVIRGGVCNVLNTSVMPVVPLVLDFTAYPNPSTDEIVNFSLTGLINGKGKISVMDMSGRLVHNIDINVSKGNNSYSLPIDVQQGIYILRLQVENNEQFISTLVKN